MADPDGREKDRKVPPGAAQESGPLKGGEEVEPNPATQEKHPSSEAERRSEEVRRGGESESRDDW